MTIRPMTFADLSRQTERMPILTDTEPVNEATYPSTLFQPSQGKHHFTMNWLFWVMLIMVAGLAYLSFDRILEWFIRVVKPA